MPEVSNQQHMQLHRRTAGDLISDLVYGANDGIVTTFAVVAGVAGANLGPMVVLIMGFANLFADGWSMASGNFLGRKSRQDYEQRERRVEEQAIGEQPEQRLACLQEHYLKKGISGETLERFLEHVRQNKKLWVDELLACELEISGSSQHKPMQHAAATFSAFVLAGCLPLLSYLLNFPNPFLFSAILTGLAFFTVGALSARVTGSGWLFSGIQMLIIGGFAGLVAYAVGYVLKQIFGISL
jgi:VIT1/CCC1 family predicted Fe2+/Mn2+ transporter